MFEVVAGTKVNHGLPDAFVERGYHLFHLVGPNTLLVPFEIGQPFDTFEINLFACKPDRARLLAEAGLLTTRRVMPPNVAPGSGIDLWRQMPCAGAAAHSQSNEPALSRAMDLYALWRSTTCDPAERYGALLASFDLLKSLVGKPGGFAIASTLARVAFEAGSRAFALELVAQMLSGMKTGRPVLDHPFWPTEARFDHVAPGGDLQVWFLAGLAEAFERWRKPTSYFGGAETLGVIDFLQSTPFASPEMERRRQLIRRRSGQQTHFVRTPILAIENPDNLNPALWQAL